MFASAPDLVLITTHSAFALPKKHQKTILSYLSESKNENLESKTDSKKPRTYYILLVLSLFE